MIPILLAAALLGVPGLAATDVAAPVAAPEPSGYEPDVAGECKPDGVNVRCRYEFRTVDHIGKPFINMTVPVVGRTLATVTVDTSQGLDACWAYDVFDARDTLHTWASDALPQVGSNGNEDTFDHLILADGPGEMRLQFDPYQCDYYYGDSHDRPFTPATFILTWHAKVLPEGIVPSRPAATLEDPHVSDAEGDADPATPDLVALWFDDARLGDESFEAHLAAKDYGGLEDRAKVNIGFVLEGVSYHLYAWLHNDGTTHVDRCGLMIRVHDGGSASTMISLPGPPCVLDLERSVLTFHILESAMSDPQDGSEFEDPNGHVEVWTWGDHGPLDRINDERYPFALGGPDVWDGYNPRLQPQVVKEDPWYMHPFAASNVADTLQVSGATLAGGTFLFGLALVHRRRKRAHDLLAEIEAIVRENRHDAARGLLALGDLEEVLDARLRARKITESEYQIASQRIATAATRLSLRRDAGLDDGVPDRAPLQPTR